MRLNFGVLYDLFAVRTLHAESAGAFDGQVLLERRLQGLDPAADEVLVASRALDFNFAVALGLVGFAVIQGEDGLARIVSALKFGFEQLFGQDARDPPHLGELGPAVGTCVVLLAVRPLLDAQRAEQTVALPAGDRLLHNVLANNALEVLVQRGHGLLPVYVRLLVLLAGHAFQKGLDGVWVVVRELFVSVLEERSDLLVKLLKFRYKRLLLKQIHLIQL